MTVGELASHSHQQEALSTPGINAAGTGGTLLGMTGGGGATGPNGPVNQNTLAAGSNTPHNNVQPYIAANTFIRIN